MIGTHSKSEKVVLCAFFVVPLPFCFLGLPCAPGLPALAFSMGCASCATLSAVALAVPRISPTCLHLALLANALASTLVSGFWCADVAWVHFILLEIMFVSVSSAILTPIRSMAGLVFHASFVLALSSFAFANRHELSVLADNVAASRQLPSNAKGTSNERDWAVAVSLRVIGGILFVSLLDAHGFVVLRQCLRRRSSRGHSSSLERIATDDERCDSVVVGAHLGNEAPQVDDAFASESEGKHTDILEAKAGHCTDIEDCCLPNIVPADVVVTETNSTHPYTDEVAGRASVLDGMHTGKSEFQAGLHETNREACGSSSIGLADEVFTEAGSSAYQHKTNTYFITQGSNSTNAVRSEASVNLMSMGSGIKSNIKGIMFILNRSAQEEKSRTRLVIPAEMVMWTCLRTSRWLCECSIWLVTYC